MLSFFVKPSVIRKYDRKLKSLDYFNPSNHLPHDEIFVGDATTATFLYLSESEGIDVDGFFVQVKAFYVNKLLDKFDFESNILSLLKFLDPSECQNVSLSTFDKIKDDFALKFDAEAVKMEYWEFAMDFEINVNIGDALQFWHTVKSMKCSMGA